VRISWWESLRPNSLSLKPAGDPAAPGNAPQRRATRWPLALAGALVVVVGAGVATWRAHSHLRHQPVRHVVSGRAGLRKTASGVSERWSAPSLTVTIDPTLAQATPVAKAAIMDAFGAWLASAANLPQVSFDTTDTPGTAVQDGVNRLLLGRIDLPGQEQDLAVTVSYADPDTGAVVEADTIFNSAYEWTSLAAEASAHGCGGRYDLQNVATHEAGHFFGLGEDYTDSATTMYVSSMPCQTSKRSVSASDVTVVQGLYAVPLAAAPAGSAGCGAQIGGRGGSGGGVLVAAALVGLVGARRQRRSALKAGSREVRDGPP
jgi:hypothetical protein